MTRDDLVKALEEIALLLELKGENPFKIRAYRNGADIVRDFEDDILQLAKDDKLKGIKGIGEALQDKLHTLATSGKLPFLEDLRSEFPEGLFDLFELQGLGPKKIKALYEQLKITSIPELQAACDKDMVSSLKGFGKKTQDKILEAITAKETFADRFLLGDVMPIAEQILKLLRMHPEVGRVAVAGSYRRSKETVHDLDFLAETEEGKLVCEDFTTIADVESVIACGETKASVRLKNGLQCDLRAVSSEQYPFALMYFTGSKEHNVAIRSRALKQGLSLNEYGFSLAKEGGKAVIAAKLREERDIYAQLGLAYIDPELRENKGEVEAAEKGPLDQLLELENLRGTFHNHTTESDGMHTLQEMADEAMDLGLAYLGIADHSKLLGFANGLDEERLAKQGKAIAKLNKTNRYLRIFHGSEVDILKDGSLDFNDDTLTTLDYVVASVHTSLQLDEKTMTRRIIRAMENEHVTMLGHMTGRLLLRRKGYEVDHAKIIDCAAETRTIIELNCTPSRLDMDWRWWRMARDKGVLCSINPDAHSIEGLHRLDIGVRCARKGWLRREDVFNTRKVGEVEKFFATPKAQR